MPSGNFEREIMSDKPKIDKIGMYEITIKDKNPRKFTNARTWKIITNVMDHALRIAFIQAFELGMNVPSLVAIVRSEDILFDVDEIRDNYGDSTIGEENHE